MHLPFDKEHELSLFVCGADDALGLEVSAEVSGGVRGLIAGLEDDAVALHRVDLLLGLHAGLQREWRGREVQPLVHRSLRRRDSWNAFTFTRKLANAHMPLGLTDSFESHNK